jgi:antitoxin component YwqK of YwqJK toxin-antitoxin module
MMIMKKLLFIYISLLTLKAQAQIYKYYFDKDWNTTTSKNAVFIGRGVKTENGVRVNFIIAENNQLIDISEYTDSSLSTINGDEIFYHPNRKLKQQSAYKMNVLDGRTQKWDMAGRLTDSIVYKEGKCLMNTQYRYSFNGIINSHRTVDSVNNTLQNFLYDSLGRLVSMVSFHAEKGTWTYYDDFGNISKIDTLFSREERDAEFPGGVKKWHSFLENNLDGTVPIRNGAISGQATAIIQFIVCTDGSVCDIKPLTHIGFGIEEEAIRVIKKSGKWIPAQHYGKPVKAFRKQPITFQVLSR